ncbi:WXG100 family type VII secretion target [Rhodococcus chondri]|uniref:WXG100 family type VII secretion target n=1 Tax=Rhodococcus chondri TaxID=3065941 RepID=A0ABU7JW29_9NOCA|nr:WXG100 family type VII secretion target [Rhodococcus sp. CC-R104]MEE2034231.1 WXG100 family type VII secretion target [Rhodococcus sp. CC-R104]
MSETGTGSSSQLSTDVVTMEVAAGQLRDSRGELDNILRALSGTVMSATDVWRSSAQTQFAGIMERWDRNGRQLNVALDDIAQAIQTSGRSYEDSVQEHSRALNSVDQGSGSVLNGSF